MKEQLGLIHDILNSLGVIANSSDLIAGNNMCPENYPLFLMIRNHSARAIKLVSKLRDSIAFKAAIYKVEAVRVAAVLEKLNSVRDSYPVAVEFRNRCAEGSHVHAQIDLMQRVVDNCVQNSIKANATKIIIEFVEPHPPNLVELRIKDNGVGMDDEALKRVGLGFSTSGGGMGTRVLMDLIIQAGGTIGWKSIQGIGTEVCIKLQRAK